MTHVHQLVVTTEDAGYSSHIRQLLDAMAEGLGKLDPENIQVYRRYEHVRREEAPHE